MFIQLIVTIVILQLIFLQFIECIRHLTKHIPDESWYVVNETRKTILIKLDGNLDIYALTGIDGIKHLTPDYANTYNYRYIEEKMLESMSVNNCTIYGPKRFLSSIYTKSIYAEKDVADLIVEEVRPPPYVFDVWGKDGKEKIRALKLFIGMNENLTLTKHFRGFIKNHYKRSKGCLNQVLSIYNRTTGKTKVEKLFNDYGATLHPHHIRCDNKYVVEAVSHGGRGVLARLPDHYRLLYRLPFLVRAKNVIIAKSGMIAFPCGPFGLFSSCEAVKWGIPIANNVVPDVDACRQSLIEGSSAHCPYQVYDKVFIMTQYDDTQIGQFMMEVFPKFVLHSEFLLANPDIKIHFGFTKQPTVPAFVLPHNYISWLGLGDRLINGTFFAKEIVMPREGGCQDAGYNAWELVNMRETLLKKLNLDNDLTPRTTKPKIVILARSSSSFYTQNKSDGPSRRWPKGFMDPFVALLKKDYPDHETIIFSDLNTTLLSCPDCQIRLFRDADIAIGLCNIVYIYIYSPSLYIFYFKTKFQFN